MFEWLKNYLLLQEIKNSSKVTKQFVQWEKVQSAIILTDSSRLSVTMDFIKQSGKNFDVIVFYNDKVSKSDACFLSLNKKDLNFFGLPKPEVLLKLKERSYDVLINTDFGSSWFMKALTGLINAKCKLGPESASYSDFFDISIQSVPQDFLKEALKYLMMIKS